MLISQVESDTDQEFKPTEEYVEFPDGPPDDLKVEIKSELDEDTTAVVSPAVTA